LIFEIFGNGEGERRSFFSSENSNPKYFGESTPKAKKKDNKIKARESIFEAA